MSGGILTLLIIKAILAHLITKTGCAAQDLLTQAQAFPLAEFWFGVDDLDHDFFTRIVCGARVPLTIGFTAAVFSVFRLGRLQATMATGLIGWFCG